MPTPLALQASQAATPSDVHASHDHFLQLYEDDAFLVDGITDYVARALSANRGAIVIATPVHRDCVHAALIGRGIDVAAVTASGQYAALDAEETLARFMVDGQPDARRFEAVAGRAIAAAGRGRDGVSAFGEMVALLTEAGDAAAAVRLEALWNALARRQSFTLYCAYPMRLFTGEGGGEQLRAVCAAHGHVTPAESYTRLPTPDAQARAIADLHRKAARLEVEVARRESAEARYRQLAFQDALTGLPNLRALREALDARLAAPGDARGVVLYLDLDNFKDVNDLHGHSSGDALLVRIAGRLRDAMPRATLTRIGGDEFVAIAPDVYRRADAQRLAEIAIAVVAAEGSIAQAGATVTASVGVAFYPSQGASCDQLLAAADVAMYAAKAAGRNTWRLYTDALGRRNDARARALDELREALARDQLRLHYQPRVDLGSGRWIGAEALLRRERPDGSLQAPRELVDAAERSGLIGPLGDWVLHEAARHSLAWRGAGVALPIAINVSALQLHDNRFTKLVCDLVAADPPLAGLLEIELTESHAVTDDARVRAAIARLRRLGIRVHIDDFGTAYSGLARLAEVEVDALKIDRVFVSRLPDQRVARAIVASIVSVARALDLQVIAEGVETSAQADALVQLGCTQAQGFLFERPLAASVLLEGFVASGRRAADRR